MRTWPLHIVFAIIFFGSVAARERAHDVLSDDIRLETAVMGVARSHGLLFQQEARIPGTDVRAFVFDAPGCSHPVSVTLLDDAFEQVPQLQPVRGDIVHYAYIDRAWEKPEPWAVFLVRIKYAALALFDLTRYTPSWHVLRVEAQPQCFAATAIDWRMVWDRDYLRRKYKTGG